MKLMECIRKDNKMLVNLFMLPIIVPLILCYVFGGIYPENIPFGVADLDNSSLSRSIVQGLENHPGLDVSYYTTSQTELQDSINDKKVNGGIIIPANYSLDLSQKKAPKAILLADGTNLMLANNALGYCSAVLKTFNAQFQLSFFEGNNMLPQTAKQKMASFSIGERVLYDPQMSYLCNLIYIVNPLVIQMYFLNLFILPAFIEEKKVLAQDKISLKRIVSRGKPLLMRIGIMGTVISIANFIGFCIAGLFYGIPVKGTLLAYFVLMMVFLLALAVMGLVLMLFINERNYSYFVGFYSIVYVLFILTSGAVWPDYMMPKGFYPVVKSIWPYAHVALPMKFLSLKGIGWDVLWPYIRDGLCFTFCWLMIAISLHALKLHRKQKALHP